MKHMFLALLFGTALLACDILPALAIEDSFALQHIRNATVKLTSDGTTFLVDPMLDAPDAYEGFPDTHRSWLRNPLTPLHMPVKDILEGVDTVISHTHLDYLDNAAQEALPRDIPLCVQNKTDAELVKGQGLTDVRIMKDADEFGGVKMDRTTTRHCSEAMYAVPELAKALGDVMGIVFTAPSGKKAWIAGDNVWFDELTMRWQSTALT